MSNFDKKDKEKDKEKAPDLEAQFAAAANAAENDAPLAEINAAKAEAPVVAPNFDPEKLVVIVPRLAQTPGASMTFSVGGKTYQIVDNKRTRVPLDVALQLREKGYCAGF